MEVLALRYEKKPPPREADEPEQYQLFETPEYSYRVFVTNMTDTIDRLVWFYNQQAGAENLIKEANHDAGLAAHPSGRWMMNCNHFQLALLTYNLNCWLMLFNREEQAQVETLKHTTLERARQHRRIALPRPRSAPRDLHPPPQDGCSLHIEGQDHVRST